jgi:biopolymer transport protein ExbD
MTFRPVLLPGVMLLIAMAACDRVKERSALSRGFHVDLGRIAEKRPTVVDECSLTIVLAHGNGVVTINEASLPVRALHARMQDTMSHRAEKIIFVGAAPEASMQDLTDVVDAVYSEADVTSLITSKLLKSALQTQSCFAPTNLPSWARLPALYPRWAFPTSPGEATGIIDK